MQFSTSYDGYMAMVTEGARVFFCLFFYWHVKLSDVSLGIRQRCSLVVDEDVKKPTKQTKTPKANDRRKLPETHVRSRK